MDSSILNVRQDIQFNDVIKKKEFYGYLPYAGTKFGNNDEIRISIQAQDVYTLIAESYVYVSGKFTSTDKDAHLVNNCIAHLFSEIRFELNNVVLDRVKDPGITSTLKGLVSFTQNDELALSVAGWHHVLPQYIKADDGYFEARIPLNILLGFAETYKKVTLNCKQELILLRAHTDDNAYLGKDGKFEIYGVEWLVPQIDVNDEYKLKILRTIKTDRPIQLAFRSWELHDLPSMKETSVDKWAIRTTNQLEKPRYVIVAFQTDRKNVKTKNASEFDHANVRNIKLYLNSDSYPYLNQELNFKTGKYSSAFYAYAAFQSSYYGIQGSNPLQNMGLFKTCPVFVIDCSHQIEDIKTGSVDVQIELEANEKFPAKTVAYALIIHDQQFEYSPLSGLVRKLI